MSAETIAYTQWLIDQGLIDREGARAKRVGLIPKDTVNVHLALPFAFASQSEPMDIQQVVATLDQHVRRQPAPERGEFRKRLIRWLLHPELGGFPESASPMPKWDDKAPMPRVGSPLCQCGDALMHHDDEGGCRKCHCNQYARGI